MTAGYAIETVNLVKRYPTSARKMRGRGFHHHHHRSRVYSLGGVFNLLKGDRGPYIEALSGVNLQIKRGEIFGILGPNGAGKTTLIKVLCNLVLHDEGEAYINGFDVQKESGKTLKNIQAVLPGSTGFSWRITGRQNLEFYAVLYGLSKKEAEERIDYLLDFTGLEDRADDNFQRYSTGMQRKLLLCRALLRDTPILLFDEPTVGLDPKSAAAFREMLHDRLVREEGKTILFSSHNINEAQEMSDRIAILDNGEVTACDTPDDIRYKMFNRKVFNISFKDAIFEKKHEKILEDLRETPGVLNVDPEISPDHNFHGLSLSVDRDMDLSRILEVTLKSGLKKKSINTLEPSLEDAFIAITSQNTKGDGTSEA